MALAAIVGICLSLIFKLINLLRPEEEVVLEANDAGSPHAITGYRAAMLPGSISKEGYVVNSARFMSSRVGISGHTGSSLLLIFTDDETFASFWPGVALYWPRCKTCCAGNIVDIYALGA